MSMQSEGKDVQRGSHQQSAGDGTRNDGTTAAPVAGQGNQQSGNQGSGIQTVMEEGGNRQSGQASSQQGALPPSQTDDDQYDQGTVRRAP